MQGFQGKKVFITGGSSGIGRATAVELARSGASVYVAARGQEQLDETLGLMRDAAASADQVLGMVSVDVTDRAAVRAAVAQVLEGLGGLDVLIANTGYARTGYVQDLPDEVFDDLMKTNYLGHVNVVRALLPHFIERGAGHLCLVSSMLGFMSMPSYAAYSASKYAILGFAEGLRCELAHRGVGVSVFYPPTTRTPGLDAENESKPREVWAMESESMFSKVYDADQVATELLKFIRSGRFEAVMGWMNVLILFLVRHFPRLARYLNDDEYRKALRKAEAHKDQAAG